MCYCTSCQAYAHALGRPDALDALGGTDLVAVLPKDVTITAGGEHLACLSLSPKGLFRWYAACCDSPLANTPRNPNIAYVGLISARLGADDQTIEAAIGPVSMTVNTDGATGGPPRKSPPSVGQLLGLASRLLGARLGGGYRRTPFFKFPGGTPVRSPRVLTQQERAEAEAAATGT